MADRFENRVLDKFRVSEVDKPLFKSIMAVEVEVINLTVFNLKEFYMMLHEWFPDNEYYDVQTGDDKFETFFMEKRDQSGLREVWSWWRIARNPRSDFFRYRLELDYHIIGMTDVEIMHKGKKIKAQKGELNLKIRGILDIDYQNKWKSNPMLVKFNRWFRWNIIKRDTQRHKEAVIDDAYKLEEVIKQFLQLKGFKDLPEGYFPPKGFA